jgi:nicotinate-nucleotide adenylyltransferase
MGGTFDPPHVGHLLAASDACDLLALDRLVFVPASRQPLKQGQATTAAPHRLAMVRLLVNGDSRFAVDEIEIQRTGLSFTVDTLEAYAHRYPDSERFFLLGIDAFALLGQWRDASRVVELARLAVLTRFSGHERMDADALTAQVHALGGSAVATPRVLETRQVDVSSTEIRARVREGRPIRGFVTEAVAQYIEVNGLYR